MGSFLETYSVPTLLPRTSFFLHKAEPNPLPSEKKIGERNFLRGGEGASVYRISGIPIILPINR